MRKISKVVSFGTVATLAVTLGGCSTTTGTATNGATNTISLTIGVPGQPPVFVNAVLYVAKAEGFFTNEGLDVTLRPFTTGADVGRAVQSGEIVGGMVATPGAIALRANGGDVVGVYGFEHPSYLIGSTDGSMTSCKQLAGHTIAIDAAGAPKALALTAMLASCGLGPNDVSTVAVGGPQTVDALVAGQVKQAVLHPDELAAVKSKVTANTVMTLASVAPLSHYTLIVTTRKQLTDPTAHENWLKVVRATKKAIDFIVNPANADKVAQVASEMTTRAVSITRPALADFLAIEFWPTGSPGLSRDRIEATVKGEVAAGNVTAANAPTYEQLVDPSLYTTTTK